MVFFPNGTLLRTLTPDPGPRTVAGNSTTGVAVDSAGAVYLSLSANTPSSPPNCSTVKYSGGVYSTLIDFQPLHLCPTDLTVDATGVVWTAAYVPYNPVGVVVGILPSGAVQRHPTSRTWGGVAAEHRSS